MPYLVLKSWYPAHKSPDVIKAFTEVIKKYPPSSFEELGELCVNNAGMATKKGLKAMSVYEVKEGHLEEALKTARSALAMFQSVEGYKYSIEVWSTLTESFESIGMQAPST